MTTRLLRRVEVEQLTTMSRSQLYLLMESGDFPRPIRIGRRAVRWRQEDIDEWLASRPTALPGGDVLPGPEPVP